MKSKNKNLKSAQQAPNAFVYRTVQDGPKVLECLERARGQEEENVHLLVKTAPEFDFLHDDPHYQELLRRLNLPQ